MTARSAGVMCAGLHIRPAGLATSLGTLALGATLLAVLFLPNGWLQVGLAGLSTLLLAADPRLGPLPAAMLVMLAIPVGRGAEVALPEIAGNPVRAHDVAAGIGMLLGLAVALPRLRRAGWAELRRPAAASIGIFLAVGVVGVAVAVLADNALRDVARDVRWWVLYGAGLLAILGAISRAAVIRALIWGMTLYALLLVLGMLMPDFEGGLKIGAWAYDPRMRLHYGQAPFLIPALAYAVMRATRQPVPWMPLAVLFAAAAGLTITRALMGSMILAAVAVALWAIWRHDGARRARRRLALPAVVAVLATVIGIGAGLGVYAVGIQIWAPPPGDQPTEATRSGPDGDSRPVVNSVDRITGNGSESLSAQAGGRFYSYADAFLEAGEAPVIGHGMGELVRVGWAWGGYRASTIGFQPGVDNAYLTVAVKAGAVGVAALAAMLLWPLRLLAARPRRRLWAWLAPAWLAMLGLTLIESFAVSGYAPLTLSLIMVLPVLRRSRR